MSRKRWMIGWLVLMSGVMGWAADVQKPNLVFIIADDCTFRDIGCYGGQAHTPNIDKLATEGMRFTRCFQTSAMCSPTRHSLYTGLYPVKSGAYPNHTFAKDHVKSIVHYLKPLGYTVALSGKRHIGPVSVFPFQYSFNKGKLETVINMDAVDGLISESAQSDKPFALFACSKEPHEPWDKGAEYRSRYDVDTIKLRPYMVDTLETRKNFRDYLAEVTFFDNEVGQILVMLKKYGLEENTLVMVVSEQGNQFPFAKWTCYDSGLQSIMVVRWPDKVTAGSVTDAMVEYVDVCPTFVEAAGGIPAPVLDGKSFMSVLQGKADQHKTHVFGLQTTRGIHKGPHHYPIRSVRSEQYKLILNLDPNAKFQNNIVNSDWFISWQQTAETGDTHAKVMVNRHFTRPGVELYDVMGDPYEMTNLAGDPQYDKVVADLRNRLEGWMDSQGDKGMETELKAFERMTSGNKEFKAWAKANRPKPKNQALKKNQQKQN